MIIFWTPKIKGTGQRLPGKNSKSKRTIFILPQISGVGHIHCKEIKPLYADVDRNIPWKYQRDNDKIKHVFFGPFTKEIRGPIALAQSAINRTLDKLIEDIRAVVTTNKVYVFYKRIKHVETNVQGGTYMSTACAACAPIDDKGVVGEFIKIWEDAFGLTVEYAARKGAGLRGEKPFAMRPERAYRNMWIIPRFQVAVESQTGDFYEPTYQANSKIRDRRQFVYERESMGELSGEGGGISTGMCVVDENCNHINIDSTLSKKQGRLYLERLFYGIRVFLDYHSRSSFVRTSRFCVPVIAAHNHHSLSTLQECRRDGDKIIIYNNQYPGAYDAHIHINDDGSLNFDTLRLESAENNEAVLSYIKISDKSGGRDRIYKFLFCRNYYDVYNRGFKNFFGILYNYSVVAFYRYINNDGSFSKWVMSQECILEDGLYIERGVLNDYTEEEARALLGRYFIDTSHHECSPFPLAVTSNRLYVALPCYRTQGTIKIIGYKQISCEINNDASLGELKICDDWLLEEGSTNTSIDKFVTIQDSFMTSGRIYCVLRSSGEDVEIGEKVNINLMWAPLYDEENPGQDEPVTAHGNYILPYPQIRATGEVKRKSVYTLPYPQIQGTGQIREKEEGEGVYILPYPQVYGTGRIERKNAGQEYNLAFPYIRGIGRIGDYDWILRFRRKEVL